MAAPFDTQISTIETKSIYKCSLHGYYKVNSSNSKLLSKENTNINNLSKIDSKNCFDKISVSIHNEKEVKIAEKLFATNLVFGHIFETDCKVGLTPRGLKQLEKICDIATIPVMAIGGINSNNYKLVLQNGAIDFAIMSSAMKLTF